MNEVKWAIAYVHETIFTIRAPDAIVGTNLRVSR